MLTRMWRSMLSRNWRELGVQQATKMHLNSKELVGLHTWSTKFGFTPILRKKNYFD